MWGLLSALEPFSVEWSGEGEPSDTREIVSVLIRADGHILEGSERINELLGLEIDKKVVNIAELLDSGTVSELLANLEWLGTGRKPFWMKQVILDGGWAHKRDVIIHASKGTSRKGHELLLYPLAALAHYEQLMEHVYTDELTEVSNFRKFKEDVTVRIERSECAEVKFGLIFLDIDDFKMINDANGHLTGDQVLRECAARLQQSALPGNTVYRKSGDEFLIMIKNVKDMRIVQENIENAFSEPFYIAGNQFLVKMSTGIGIYPEQGRTAEELMEWSDRALYQVKRFRHAAEE